MPSPALIAAAALWVHFFWSLVPSWRFGDYYSYGFFVPPIVLAFALRRGSDLPPEASAPTAATTTPRLPLFLAVILPALLLLVPLRIIEMADPGWRPPLLAHGLLVTALSHWLLALHGGWRFSAYLLPVTVFAWSAVPYPMQVEQAIVRTLTSWVAGFTQEIFLLAGRPVIQAGDRLMLGTSVVEITDGCSGIRSIQSLLMAALFFGELLWLTWPKRILMLGCGLLAAIICNTARAWYLAETQFHYGAAPAGAAHDRAGHLAFLGAAVLLYLAALVLSREGRERSSMKVTTSTVRTPVIPAKEPTP